MVLFLECYIKYEANCATKGFAILKIWCFFLKDGDFLNKMNKDVLLREKYDIAALKEQSFVNRADIA